MHSLGPNNPNSQPILLGKGGFSKVELHIVNGIEYARKVIPRNAPSCYQEVKITKHLQGGKGIIRLVDSDQDEHNLYLVLEKCSLPIRPAMDDILEQKRYTHNAIVAIKSVHDRGIIHNDVKPENFMISPLGVMNIIDFGTSMYVEQGTRDMITQGTPVYCSPEMLTSFVCKKTDVWAIGIMTFHALTGMYPFYNRNMHLTFKEILEKDIDVASIKQIAGKYAADFVERTLDKDVGTRMCIDEALEHPWLGSL